MMTNLSNQTQTTNMARFSKRKPDTVIVKDRATGRSKGFGFVEMADEETAASAIERFNDTDLGGRTIKVAEARPRRNRERDRSNQ